MASDVTFQTRKMIHALHKAATYAGAKQWEATTREIGASLAAVKEAQQIVQSQHVAPAGLDRHDRAVGTMALYALTIYRARIEALIGRMPKPRTILEAMAGMPAESIEAVPFNADAPTVVTKGKPVNSPHRVRNPLRGKA